jgi:arginine decarboxylase
MTAFGVAQARELYSIRHWSEGYFDVDAQGRMVVLPTRAVDRAIALTDVVQEAKARGANLPLLVRFPEVLSDKSARLVAAFDRAAVDWKHSGGYTAVFPIKVNQQHDVVNELISANHGRLGLEAGSKPELIAVLAMSPKGIVICNGYKDREYIRLALIGRKLGLNVFIVLEKAGELGVIMEEAKALGVEPKLGVRMRLASIGAGKWQNTGGDKAKFGLSPRQVLNVATTLKAHGMAGALELVHFHMGSQISNVRDIATGMREACSYFVELNRLGMPIRYMDVGGGLAVDYEGTRSRSFCSMNYGLDQYASTIIGAVVDTCDQHGLAHPHLITEAGRAMCAHHAVLVTNITAVEPAPDGSAARESKSAHPAVKHLRELLEEVDQRAPMEAFQEAQHFLQEGQTLFALGQLGLSDRAELDDCYYAIVQRVKAGLRDDSKAHRQVLDELNEKLADKYFANFSVFQSVPDVWAIDQVFPIVPLTRLNEAPTRRGVLEDLTCDSDGRIDLYVDSEGLESSLPLHALKPNEPYLLGLFLVGAYQETLGDIHNLFGDTDSVNARTAASGFALDGARRGDTADKLLSYVGFDVADLQQRFDLKLAAAALSDDERAQFRSALNQGLSGYTYLHD